jgi:hypothetical protein
LIFVFVAIVHSDNNNNDNDNGNGNIVAQSIGNVKIGILNRASNIDVGTLNKILKAIEKQVERDFSPYYGTKVDITIVDDQTKVDWDKTVPMIISNDFTNMDPDNLGSHGIVNLRGALDTIVTNPPELNIGSTVIFINAKAIYNNGVPFNLPTFEAELSTVMSHEVLELLGNYQNSKHYYTPYIAGPYILFDVHYVGETADPTEFAPGYKIDGVWVADFVLPSYWKREFEVGPYNFLDTIISPLSPYKGLQPGWSSGGFFTIGSSLANPSNVFASLKENNSDVEVDLMKNLRDATVTSPLKKTLSMLE